MNKCERFSRHTTWYIGYLQFVGQDSAQELIIHIQDIHYTGFSRSEFHVRCLCIRLDNQRVVCVHSVGLGSSYLVLVIFLDNSRGSTSFILM